MPQETIDLGHYLKGEVPPDITLTFRDPANQPIDLTTFTIARFLFKRTDGVLQDKPATILNQSTNKGQVRYTWASTDMATVGRYSAEFWVTNEDKKFASQQMIFQVGESLGPPF